MMFGNIYLIEFSKMEGLLNKYTNVVKGWQYRWFVMDAESGMLEYFEVSSYVIIFPESEECLSISHLTTDSKRIHQ